MRDEQHDEYVTGIALRAGRGDKAALSEFIKLTQGDVWRLHAHLAGPDQADDLTQETFLRVISALPRFAARSTAKTWILTLARRVWVDSIRYDMARPKADHSRTAPAELGGANLDNAWSDWIDFNDLIKTLPPERKEALVLTQIMGYTYDEAAAIVGVRVGTIRSRVSRARAEIIDRLELGK